MHRYDAIPSWSLVGDELLPPPVYDRNTAAYPTTVDSHDSSSRPCSEGLTTMASVPGMLNVFFGPFLLCLGTHIFVFMRLPSFATFTRVRSVKMSITCAVCLRCFNVQRILVLLSMVSVERSINERCQAGNVPLIRVRDDFRGEGLIVEICNSRL